MPLKSAETYLERGWLPIPLVERSKRPAIKWAHMCSLEPPFDPAFAWPWKANIGLGVGILLKPSGLLVIDADSEEAVREVIENTTEPCANIVQTRNGAHFYYRRPEGCPPLRTVQRGRCRKIDVLADGYVVTSPSVHPSGFQYKWIATGELQDAPDWACGLLLALKERQKATIGEHTPESVLSAYEITLGEMNGLNTKCCEWNFGFAQPVDRSRAIWLTLNTLIRSKQYSDASILRLLWYGHLREKPRERGWDWLCGELARARQELTP